MQFFKNGDELEQKSYSSGKPAVDNIDLDLSEFYESAYTTGPLGDVLYDTGRAPLANAIDRNIYRTTFNELFDAFSKVGTFEAYLTVFRKIFGNDVDVDFTVPSPGTLNIDIIAAGVELSDFVARRIENNEYVFDNVVDHEENQIVFQTVKGFTSQYELEQMLYEMVPDGIYTEISLTVGE